MLSVPIEPDEPAVGRAVELLEALLARLPA